CDVLLDDRFVNLFYLNNNPKAPFVELQETLPDEDCGIAVAKDNPGLLERLNNTINELKRNGVLPGIYDKWLKPQFGGAH
ncbi:MAG: transporter substrate-binding domain-containing protein, partial [Succinivibrionaceae bacterium]|nr:transporter substrate-binding domain-containing protein [Succinivibrionaceae bacterium]